MSYFKKVKQGQEVFGLVFGKGKVINAWGVMVIIHLK